MTLSDKTSLAHLFAAVVQCSDRSIKMAIAEQLGFVKTMVSYCFVSKSLGLMIVSSLNILFDFFAFCSKHNILFEVSLTSTYAGTSLPQMGYVEFTCGGKRIDQKHISDLLGISHSSFKTDSFIYVFPRYWRGIFGEQKVDNVSDFIRVIVEKWLKKEKELYYLSQTIDGFSAEVFFSLEGVVNFCFSFSPILLYSLAKTRTSIRLFIREI